MLINKEYTFNNYCFIVGFRQVFRFPKGFRHQKSLRTADLVEMQSKMLYIHSPDPAALFIY